MVEFVYTKYRFQHARAQRIAAESSEKEFFRAYIISLSTGGIGGPKKGLASRLPIPCRLLVGDDIGPIRKRPTLAREMEAWREAERQNRIRPNPADHVDSILRPPK